MAVEEIYENSRLPVRYYADKVAAWLSGELINQKSRLILWLPVTLALGIALYFQLDSEPPLMLGPVLSLFSGSLLVLVWNLREHSEAHFAVYVAASVLFWSCTGFSAAQIRTHSLAAPVLRDEMGPVDIAGTIEDIDRLDKGGSVRLTLIDPEIEDLPEGETPHKIRIKVHDGTGLKNGMRVKMLAGINPPSPPVAPGAFDFQRYSWFKRLGGVGFSYSKPEIVDAGDKGNLMTFDYLRQVVAKRVDEHVGWPDASIVSALMTGEVAAIPEEDMEAMRNSGLAHMLALSGMNVGIIAGCVFFLSRFIMALFPSFALRHPIKKYSAALAFIAIYAYTFFVGANVPVFRALLMSGVVLLAVMLDRKAFSMRLVALAAFVILLFSPESLMGASFQMSFSAVAAIIYFFETFRPQLAAMYRNAGIARKCAMYLLGICVTTLLATLATAPFALFHFQRLALFGVLANLLATPVMTFIIMPFVVLSYITIPVGAEFLTLPVAGQGVEWLREIAHWTSSLEGSVWLVPQWPETGFAAIVLGAVFLLLWSGRLRIAGIPIIVAGLVLVGTHKTPDILVSSSAKLTAFLDGKGQMHASSRMYDRYDRENWARMQGLLPDDVSKWPREGTDEDRGITCGEEGCRLDLYEHKIAFLSRPYANLEDCAWAEILIAPHPVDDRECRVQVIIDRFDVWEHGAHSITFENGRAVVRTVAGERGNRPWHGSPSR
jgi:competence protein ComEC